MIDWKQVTDNPQVIELIKQMELIMDNIRALDEQALINYELQCLQSE